MLAHTQSNTSSIKRNFVYINFGQIFYILLTMLDKCGHTTDLVREPAMFYSMCFWSKIVMAFLFHNGSNSCLKFLFHFCSRSKEHFHLFNSDNFGLIVYFHQEYFFNFFQIMLIYNLYLCWNLEHRIFSTDSQKLLKTSSIY